MQSEGCKNNGEKTNIFHTENIDRTEWLCKAKKTVIPDSDKLLRDFG